MVHPPLATGSTITLTTLGDHDSVVYGAKPSASSTGLLSGLLSGLRHRVTVTPSGLAEKVVAGNDPLGPEFSAGTLVPNRPNLTSLCSQTGK
jgi:hypothetical protein